MKKRARRNDRLQSASLQMGIAFPIEREVLDPKTRTEIVTLLARLLLDVARHSVEPEVRDDAS